MPNPKKPQPQKPGPPKESHLARILSARRRTAHFKGRVDTLTKELSSAKKALKAAASELLEQIEDPMGTLFDEEVYSDACDEALSSPKKE